MYTPKTNVGVLHTVVGCGVDYLTITTVTLEHRKLLRTIYDTLAQGFIAAKEEVQKPFRFKGYKGYRCGPVQWGHRQDSDILMVAGELANDVSAENDLSPHRVRRLDLQVTIRMNEAAPRLISEAYEKLTTSDDDDRIKCSSLLLQNSKGGETLYLGARTSDRTARLYDKGVQAGIAKKGILYRYELELKRNVSQAHWDSLRATDHDQAVIIAWVWKHFKDRGVTPVFDSVSSIISVEYNGRTTGIDKSLLWLENSVRPTVKKVLLAERGQDLADAMGVAFIDPTTGEFFNPSDLLQ
jgi:hypothetical protein